MVVNGFLPNFYRQKYLEHCPPLLLYINKMQNWGKSVCKLYCILAIEFHWLRSGNFLGSKWTKPEGGMILPLIILLRWEHQYNHQYYKLPARVFSFTMPIPARQSKLKSIFCSLHVEVSSLISPPAWIFFELQKTATKYSLTSTKPKKKVSNDFKSKFGCSQVLSNIKLKSYMSNFRSGNLCPGCEDLLRL